MAKYTHRTRLLWCNRDVDAVLIADHMQRLYGTYGTWSVVRHDDGTGDAYAISHVVRLAHRGLSVERLRRLASYCQGYQAAVIERRTVDAERAARKARAGT